MDNVKTGKTAFQKSYGRPLKDWLEDSQQAAEVFNEAHAIKAAGSHSTKIEGGEIKWMKS